MATAKASDVTKPMTTVDRRARGMATAGCVASSARWMAPSRPEKMKFGLTRPVRKTMPGEDQPESLTKVVQTKVLVCFWSDLARQVMVITKKKVKERKTALGQYGGWVKW